MFPLPYPTPPPAQTLDPVSCSVVGVGRSRTRVVVVLLPVYYFLSFLIPVYFFLSFLIPVIVVYCSTILLGVLSRCSLPRYEGSERASGYPTIPVLKTTSPDMEISAPGMGWGGERERERESCRTVGLPVARPAGDKTRQRKASNAKQDKTQQIK